jgi:hypothetical protein
MQDRESKLFYKTKLDRAGEPKPDIITVRFNSEERAQLEAIKKAFDIGSDSSALKELCFTGFNVIQATFRPDFLKWLTDRNRVRLSDK